MTNTSPGSTAPGAANFSTITVTALSSTPTKAGMPAPEHAISPFASVIPVPMSSTS